MLVHPETDKTAKLAVKVSEYSRLGASINFDSIELVGKSDEYTYSVIGDSSIPYTLYGMDTTFETLDRSKMEFSLDVTGLEPGIPYRESGYDGKPAGFAGIPKFR